MTFTFLSTLLKTCAREVIPLKGAFCMQTVCKYFLSKEDKEKSTNQVCHENVTVTPLDFCVPIKMLLEQSDTDEILIRVTGYSQ